MRPDSLARRAFGARLCCCRSIQLCRAARATAVGRASQDAAGDLHATAQSEPLRLPLSRHVRGRWTIAIRQRNTTRRDCQIEVAAFLTLARDIHTRVAISMWSRGGLCGLERPYGRIPSVSARAEAFPATALAALALRAKPLFSVAKGTQKGCPRTREASGQGTQRHRRVRVARAATKQRSHTPLPVTLRAWEHTRTRQP